MAALENEHQLINKIMQMEYEKTLKSTNKLFGAPKPTQEKLKKIIPCIAWRTKVRLPIFFSIFRVVRNKTEALTDSFIDT